MVYCLKAPSHYLDQCWLLSEVWWHSPESNFTACVPATILYNESENYTFTITATYPRGQWVNECMSYAQTAQKTMELPYNSIIHVTHIAWSWETHDIHIRLWAHNRQSMQYHKRRAMACFSRILEKNDCIINRGVTIHLVTIRFVLRYTACDTLHDTIFAIHISDILLYPLNNEVVGGGVYWFHFVRLSVRPSVRPSVLPVVSAL